MTHEKKFYRADLDGLRAIAIANVVAYHAFPTLFPWGFLGVDIFFVISGFLITSLITNSWDKNQLNLIDFYTRRIKRLAPTLILVLIACYAFGWFALYSPEFAQLGRHIYGGIGFFINILLWQESGYFDTKAMLKPLLHLWSLAVEIQFYLIWPVILWGALKKNLNLIKLALSILSISIVMHLVFLWKDPSAAFYFSFNRFWEFQVGSLCALYYRNSQYLLDNVSPKFATKMGNFGLLLMLIAFGFTVVQPHHSIFVSLLITLSILCLILFPHHSWMHQYVLRHPWLIGLGLISYPLYLWHWPLISFGQIITNGGLSILIKVLLISLAVFLAYMTFRWFERYLRYGSPLVTWCLLLVMVLIANQGWSTYARNGLEFREKRIKDSFGGRPAQVDDACLKRFGHYQPNFCRLSTQSQSLEDLLIGDSIAHNHFEGLANTYQQEGKSFAMVGWPGQKPLLKDSGDENYDPEISKKMNELIISILTDSQIKTVYLSTRLSNITNYSIFESQFKKTVQVFRANGKQVVYIFPPPEISFDPIECIGLRPFRPVLRSECVHLISQPPEQTALFKNQLLDLLTHLKVASFDPTPNICSLEQCSILTDNNILLYRERGYLTTFGSKQAFKNFKIDWVD